LTCERGCDDTTTLFAVDRPFFDRDLDFRSFDSFRELLREENESYRATFRLRIFSATAKPLMTGARLALTDDTIMRDERADAAARSAARELRLKAPRRRSSSPNDRR
jgi:hypothetical protein